MLISSRGTKLSLIVIIVHFLTKRNYQCTIPITQGTYKLQDVPPTSIISDAASVTTDDLTICAPSNLSIPGRTVEFITGKLNVPCDATSALVDPSTQSLMHIGVARSMSPLSNGTYIPLQVMNISPTPVTIYKGTKLAKAIPEYSVMLVSDITLLVSDTATTTTTPAILDQIDMSQLKGEERTELTKLLTTFSQVFAEDPIPTGQTSVVKHCIPATGPPI